MRTGEISFVLAAVLCAVIMLSKTFLHLVFFCSTSFSLKCYTGGRLNVDGQTRDNKPVEEETCEKGIRYCYKGNIHGTGNDEQGVKRKFFAASAGCEEDGICPSNGCHDLNRRLPYGSGEGTVCCCSSDFCFASHELEKFIKEKSSDRPVFFIPFLVLLLL